MTLGEPMPLERTDRAEQAMPTIAGKNHLVRSAAAGAAHDLARFLVVIDRDLDLLAAEWLSPGGGDAVRSLRAVASHLRGLTRELRMVATGSGVRVVDHRTRLAVWWPHMDALLHAMRGDDAVVGAEIPPDRRASESRPVA